MAKGSWPTEVVVTLVALFVTSVCVLHRDDGNYSIGFADAASSLAVDDADCECGYGFLKSVSADGTTCYCACPDEYVLPNCLYGPEENTRLWIVVNNTLREDFVTGNFVEPLKESLGIPSGENVLYFRYYPTGNDTYLVVKYPPPALVFQISILGKFQQRIIDDIEAGNVSYILEHQIIHAEAYIPDIAATNELGSNVVLYSSPMIGVVTANTVGWLFGALVLFLLLCCGEMCCLNGCGKKEESEFISAIQSSNDENRRQHITHSHGDDCDSTTVNFEVDEDDDAAGGNPLRHKAPPPPSKEVVVEDM